jgi:chromosome segregation ATPase
LGSPFVPDQTLDQLDAAARRIEDELASWRRRCLKAETELEESRGRLPAVTSGDLALIRQRITDLEAENETLRERIGNARLQIEQLRTRLRFVGDQVSGNLQ